MCRGVPNATAGHSPFEMMHGRVPLGPLTLVQKCWSDDWPVSHELNTPTENYLKELKGRLEAANQRAGASTDRNQAVCAGCYNLGARDKEFERGDQVLLQEL